MSFCAFWCHGSALLSKSKTNFASYSFCCLGDDSYQKPRDLRSATHRLKAEALRRYKLANGEEADDDDGDDVGQGTDACLHVNVINCIPMHFVIS